MKPSDQISIYQELTERYAETEFASAVEMCKLLLNECSSSYVIDCMIRDRFGLGLIDCSNVRKDAIAQRENGRADT